MFGKKARRPCGQLWCPDHPKAAEIVDEKVEFADLISERLHKDLLVAEFVILLESVVQVIPAFNSFKGHHRIGLVRPKYSHDMPSFYGEASRVPLGKLQEKRLVQKIERRVSERFIAGTEGEIFLKVFFIRLVDIVGVAGNVVGKGTFALSDVVNSKRRHEKPFVEFGRAAQVGDHHGSEECDRVRVLQAILLPSFSVLRVLLPTDDLCQSYLWRFPSVDLGDEHLRYTIVH